MSNCDMLEEHKKDIRSLLMTYQKGCTLSEFIRAYRDMIGKRLPSRELGFKSDIDFLYSIRDVVRVQATFGDYHLQGIANEETQHIQKMVCRQKPAKLKLSAIRSARSTSRFYTAPRFNESFSNPVRNFREPVRNLTEIKRPSVANKTFEPVRNLPETKRPSVPNKTFEPVRNLTETKPLLSSVANTTSPKEEVVSLVKRFKNGIALMDFHTEYTKMYGKSFALSDYGFSSLENCLEDVSELVIVNRNNEFYVIHRSESSKFSENKTAERKEDFTFSTITNNSGQNHVENMKVNSPEPSRSSSSGYSRSKTCDNGLVTESMLSKLQKVAKTYPQGILSTNFPANFEAVTHATFDLHSLGYKSLSDFIDDVPEIFIRKPVIGSRTDYIIYPAGRFDLESNVSFEKGSSSLSKDGVSIIDHIILNVRKILEAYPEGIQLKDFLHVYSLNCQDSLCVNDLGFGNLETFLSSIKERVPLKLDILNGLKTITLLKLSDYEIELPYSSVKACEKEAIPFDAVFPEFQFKKLSFPKKFDFSKYFPVFVSSMLHPSHLYIQLNRNAKSEIWQKIYYELHEFYEGKQSKLYAMKDVHIKPGAACAGFWPKDQRWYRAHILSILDMETVKVQYVDYGDIETIPKSLLRYIKKDFADVPAQGLRSVLASIKPSNNATQWDPKARMWFLSKYTDASLMAKIDEIKEDGVYSLFLCDTNGDQDVFINDALFKEGLATLLTDNEPTKSFSVSPEPPVNIIPEPVLPTEYHSLNPLQALQAQYFLHAFAAVVPSYAQNEHYLMLLRQVSMQCPDPTQPNTNLSLNPVVGAPSTTSLFSSGNPSFVNSNLFDNTYPGTTDAFQSTNNLYSNGIDAQNNFSSVGNDYIISPRIQSPTPSDMYSTSATIGGTSMENKFGDSDVFDDDDDEFFQEFCQKLSRRFVRRIALGDGYRIHIVVSNSKPYASSGDISQLIWNNKEADYLFRRLQLKEVDIFTLNLSEDGNEKLFYQLEMLNVKGVQKTSGFKSSILLYPMKEVIKILNIFGHPSLSLRKKITEEINSFDPHDPVWEEFSAPDVSESEEEEEHNSATDDDKIERLCLYDLYAIKEGIKCRRLKMMNDLKHSENSSHVDEISKLEQMQLKVLRRIEEIKEICEMYT